MWYKANSFTQYKVRQSRRKRRDLVPPPVSIANEFYTNIALHVRISPNSSNVVVFLASNSLGTEFNRIDVSQNGLFLVLLLLIYLHLRESLLTGYLTQHLRESWLTSYLAQHLRESLLTSYLAQHLRESLLAGYLTQHLRESVLAGYLIRRRFLSCQSTLLFTKKHCVTT